MLRIAARGIEMATNNGENFKIVITGGPGGGKTTALDLIQREFRSRVKIVPEAATLLFEHGLRREENPERQKMLQHGIYKMQLSLEDTFHSLHSDRLLVCDRGTLDGLAYWPDGEADYFNRIGSTIEREIARYDAVIFFQSSAASGDDIKSNNPYRWEDAVLANELDQKLQAVWKRHPNYNFVPTNPSFMLKLAHGLITINEVLTAMTQKRQG